MSTALGKVCAACGVERKRKSMMYHPDDFMPYCENPYICNSEHPNSPKNLIARGSELKLLTFEEAQEKFQKWIAFNHPDKERAQRIRRMVARPTTIRIGSPEMAQFLLDLQDRFQFDSISDAVRYCIRKLMEAEEGFFHEYKKLEEEREEERQFEEAKKEVEQALEAPTQQETAADDDDDDLVF
jgi:Arc/MetJ-type ribon-helix-helix transcriptional regulator